MPAQIRQHTCLLTLLLETTQGTLEGFTFLHPDSGQEIPPSQPTRVMMILEVRMQKTAPVEEVVWRVVGRRSLGGQPRAVKTGGGKAGRRTPTRSDQLEPAAHQAPHAIAAVSVLNLLRDRQMGSKPAAVSAAHSASENPPDGPIAPMAGLAGTAKPAAGRPAGSASQREPACPDWASAAASGNGVRTLSRNACRDCRRAAPASRCQRSNRRPAHPTCRARNRAFET